MKCINKNSFRCLAMTIAMAVCFTFTSCGVETKTSYHVYDTSDQLGLSSSENISTSIPLFASNLCLPVLDDSDQSLAPDVATTAYSAALFDETTHQTIFNYKMTERVYPASTTKILTALVALKYGNLDQNITCSKEILNIDSDSSVAHLMVGDTLTLRQLLYGLMLPSGNDAAIAIAEGVSGSLEDFVNLMNQEAQSIGATNSHFITVNGLHDENHYTTAYDMYLIFRAACEYDDFIQLISAKSFDASFTGADGSIRQVTWNNTNRYLSGKFNTPEGITVLGGKTGTTGEARYCLVQLSTAQNGDRLISCVFGADAPYNLYLDTSEMLKITNP